MRYSNPRNRIPASRKSELEAQITELFKAVVQSVTERATRFFGE